MADEGAHDLIENRIDVAIPPGNADEPQLAKCKLADASERILFASPTYLDRHPEIRAPEGLQRRNRLTWPLDGRFEDGRACWRFRGSGGMRELRVSGNLRVNNVDVLRAAALAGLSIALLPAWCVARELAADRLSRGLPQWQVTPTTFDRCIYAAYQRRPHLPPKILAFVDILAQVLRGGCWRRSSPARRPRIFSPRASLLLGGHYSQACPDGSCSPRLRSRRGHAGAGEAVAGPFAYARPGALGRARQGGRREADGKQTP